MPTQFLAQREAVLIILYLGIIGITLVTSWNLIKKKTNDSFHLAVALTTICLSLLYLCFGPLVMMHFTGFYKAAALFFFLVPFMMSFYQEKMNKGVIVFFASLTILNLIILFNDGILAPAH